MKGQNTNSVGVTTNTINSHMFIGSNEKSRLMAVALSSLITGALLMFAFMAAGRANWQSYLVSVSSTTTRDRVAAASSSSTNAAATIQSKAILHYATSKVVPQQSLQEVTESYNVLVKFAPCNFLVFGLGYDSLMWASLNPNGTTLFLEESQEWVQIVLKKSPFLNAKTVAYRTQLQEADRLLATYRGVPECQPTKAYLEGNRKCRLALENLPSEVYKNEWDVIMIDAPRGYFNEAPGRMAAIYSAAVMARNRKRVGNTHVFLHDVDRKVEMEFAKEFLCMKYKVGGVGRLWHFEIPPVDKNDTSTSFC